LPPARGFKNWRPGLEHKHDAEVQQHDEIYSLTAVPDGRKCIAGAADWANSFSLELPGRALSVVNGRDRGRATAKSWAGRSNSAMDGN